MLLRYSRAILLAGRKGKMVGFNHLTFPRSSFHCGYCVVKKIMSGGQTGADRAALDWAIENDVARGKGSPFGLIVSGASRKVPIGNNDSQSQQVIIA